MSNASTLRQLSAVAKKLGETPSRLHRAMGNASTEIRKLVADEFATGTNPWGRPWPAHKDSSDSGPVLRRTGALASSVSVALIGGSIVTKVGAPYSRYLQRGRRRMSKFATAGGILRQAVKGRAGVIMRPRVIVPFKKLPPTWELAIAQSFEKEMAK